MANEKILIVEEILIVEDESVVSMDIENRLRNLGCTVDGLCRSHPLTRACPVYLPRRDRPQGG